MKKTLTLLLGAATMMAYAEVPNSISKMDYSQQSATVQTTYGDDITRAADKVEMPTPILQLDFNDPADLLKATIGNKAEFDNTGGDLEVVDGPNGKNAVTVKLKSFFTVDLSNSPKFTADKTTLDQWTMVCDVRMPEMYTWYTFFNTYPHNPENSDGEVFIGKVTNQIGGYHAGYGIGSWSEFIFSADTWYRVALTFDANAVYCGYYVDGDVVLEGNNPEVIPGSRFCPAKKLVLFGDDDGDDGTWDVANIKIYDQKLTAEQVRLLGVSGTEVTPSGINNTVADKKIGVFCDAAAKCMHVALPEGKSEITIADIAGRVVLSETVEGSKFSWNYSGIAKGAYVVTVANGGKTQAVKMMVN